MEFADESVAEFLEAVAAGQPTPGGGSAAAIAGATGAALCGMVSTVTVRQEEFADVESDLRAVHEAVDADRERLLALADEDAAAFEAVMDASRENDGEAVQVALQVAADVAVEIAERCLAVLEHAAVAAEKGDPNTVTDAGTSALLAHAALEGALDTAAINLSGINDEGFVEATRSRASQLRTEADGRLRATRGRVDERLALDLGTS